MTRFEYTLLLLQLPGEPPMPPALGVWLRGVFAGVWLLRVLLWLSRRVLWILSFLTPSAASFSKGVKPLEKERERD